MKKRFLPFLTAILVLLPLLGGCASYKTDSDGRLSVVAVTFPPYDFARAIAGEHASVTMLLNPGTETHSYDPTPQDIRRISDCDILIYGGGKSDEWMDSILDSMDTEKITVISMTDLVDLLEEETKEGMTAAPHAHGDEDTHAHDTYDEHVWTSPSNAAEITAAICEAMCHADEANASVYRDNAAAYMDEIKKLAADFSAMTAAAPRRTVIFADRFPFLYFAREFALDYYAAFPGCAEQTEPGAQTIAFLTKKVAEEKIPAVFYTEFSNQQLADSICEATGAQKLLMHSCHNVSKSDFDAGVTYLSLMRENLENLRKALN